MSGPEHRDLGLEHRGVERVRNAVRQDRRRQGPDVEDTDEDRHPEQSRTPPPGRFDTVARGGIHRSGRILRRCADLPEHLLYTRPVAKRGYTRDTIRGGASEWDVSRPFSSYARTLAMLVVHPGRFFELLPRIPDVRAPALFLTFCGLPAALLWLIFLGPYPALVALALPLPLSFLLAALYHLSVLGGRYGYTVTWRILAYPLGFYLPFAAVPLL